MKGYRPGTALGISQALSERQRLRTVRLVPEGKPFEGCSPSCASKDQHQQLHPLPSPLTPGVGQSIYAAEREEAAEGGLMSCWMLEARVLSFPTFSLVQS